MMKMEKMNNTQKMNKRNPCSRRNASRQASRAGFFRNITYSYRQLFVLNMQPYTVTWLPTCVRFLRKGESVSHLLVLFVKLQFSSNHSIPKGRFREGIRCRQVSKSYAVFLVFETPLFLLTDFFNLRKKSIILTNARALNSSFISLSKSAFLDKSQHLKGSELNSENSSMSLQSLKKCFMKTS